MKYRIKLSNGRIVGPFTKEQVGELFLRGHVKGTELCQTFPAGDWKKIKSFKELVNLLKGIKDKKITLQDLKQGGDSKTVVNLDIAKKLKEIKKEKDSKKNDETSEIEIEVSEPEVEIDEEVASDEDSEFKEFQFNKTEVSETLADTSSSDDEELEEENEEEESSNIESTVIVKRPKKAAASVDKTVITNPPAAVEEEHEEDAEEEEGPSEEEVKKEKEEKLKTEKTEFLNVNEFLPDIKNQAKEAEKEFEIAKKEAEQLKKDLEEDEEDEYEEEEAEEEEEGPKTLAKRPIVLIAFLAIIGYLYFDEEKKGPPPLVPIIPRVEFPLIGEFEEPKKAAEQYEMALKQLAKGTFPGKVRASDHLKKSLQFKFHGNDAFTLLLLTYAELLPDVVTEAKKFKAGKVLHKMLEMKRNVVYSDHNVALASAMYYDTFDKDQTALNTIENYIRLKGQLSGKLLAMHLKLLLQAADLEKAEKVVGLLNKMPSKTLEVYLQLSNFLKTSKKYEEGKKLIKEASEKYKNSVAVLIEYSTYLLRDGDMERYKNAVKAIRQLGAESSPLFTAKYLEMMGMLAAAKGDIKSAAERFKKALDMHDSDKLRSKLANLEISGADKQAENLIKESKVIELMRHSEFELRKHNLEAALRLAIEASDTLDYYVPAKILLSKIQMAMGFFHNAVKTLEKARKKDPRNPRVTFHLIMAYVEAFRMRDAKREFEAIQRTEHAESYRFQNVLGHYYVKTGEIKLAIRSFLKATQKNPLFDKGFYQLALIYLRARKYQQAKYYLKEAIDLDPSNLEYRTTYAKIMYELQSADVAIGYLRKLLQDHNDHPKLIADITMYYYLSGQLKAFERYREKIQNMDQKDPDFYKFMIRQSNLYGKGEDVIKYTEQLLKIRPGELDFRKSLGEFYLTNKKLAEAQKEFEKIVEMLDLYPEAHYYLARIHLEKKEFEKALEYADKEIKVNPRSEKGYFVKGEIFKAQEDWVKAIQFLEMAIRINGKSVEALGSLAWIKLKQNFLPQALDLYTRAIKEDPGVAELHKFLGDVYRLSGQGGLAAEKYKTYLELAPEGEFASEVKGHMQNLL